MTRHSCAGFLIGQFRPDFVPVVRAKVAAGNFGARLFLDADAQFFSGRSISICDVPEKRPRSAAALRKLLSLSNRQRH